MTKGRIPFKALELAEPIAEKRGEIQHYVREPGTICDFEILAPGIVAKVAMRCVRRLRCTISEIERECASRLAEIRIIASSKEISRELWLCSPRYAYRFFRVLDRGLLELRRDGSPLAAANPGPEPVPARDPADHATGISPDKNGDTSGTSTVIAMVDEKKNPDGNSGKDSITSTGNFPAPDNKKDPAGESAGVLPGKSGMAASESTGGKNLRKAGRKSRKKDPGKAGGITG
jgi:hypothetical protein